MDDLTGKIQEILGDPGKLEQIKSMAAMMGFSEENPISSSEPAKKAEPSLDLGGMMNLLPLLNKGAKQDETINFLLALRPLLGEARQRKIDEAIKILRILNLLPLLKNTGILSSLFS